MNYFIGLWVFFYLLNLQAQTLPIGLYEGYMGNSGVAISESKAASFYNPSLLRSRKNDSFSLGGTTIGSSAYSSDGMKNSVAVFTPSYISAIYTGDSLNHELFFLNLLSGNFKISGQDGLNTYESYMSASESLAGYSMAFVSFPLALQFAVQYSDVHAVLFSEYLDTVNDVYVVGKTNSSFKKLGFVTGVSTHVTWSSYTFGVKYLSRGLELYGSSKGRGKIYTSTLADYTIEPAEGYVELKTFAGHTLTIGHGIALDNHEFLFDSILKEDGGKLNRYDFIQTFGYRLKVNQNHQFFFGLNHLVREKMKYFGENLYTSTGYAWRKNKLQSAIGMYYHADQVKTKGQSFGVNFSSEFSY